MFSIIKKVIITSIKGSKYIYFVMFFPIFLMTLLGLVLTNAMGRDWKIGAFKIYYYNQGSQSSQQVMKIVEENHGDINFSVVPIESVEKGQEQVRKGNGVFVHATGDILKVYFNEKVPVEEGVTTALLNGISHTQNAAIQMMKMNPQKAGPLLQENKGVEVPIEEVKTAKSPNSFEYYGVAELALMVMYLAFFPLAMIDKERRMNIKSRIRMTGISTLQYYLYNLMGYMFMGSLIMLPGYLFSIYGIHANWGPNPVITYFAFLSLTFLFMTFGMLVSVVSKSTEKAQVVMNSVVFPTLAALGGSYLNIPDQLPAIFQVLTSISPLRWFNRGVFRWAFGGDSSILVTSVIINVSISLVFILLLIVATRKEEVTQ